MINIRREGEVIQTGFNFYPLDDSGSAGFIFQGMGKRLIVRYSKITKKWTIRNGKV
jgi:hypothetical protein